MPRFYFDLFLGSHSDLDEEGHEIISIRAAETEAVRTAGELARDRLLTAREKIQEDVRVEVRNECRRPILSVRVSIQVDRMNGCHDVE